MNIQTGHVYLRTDGLYTHVDHISSTGDVAGVTWGTGDRTVWTACATTIESLRERAAQDVTGQISLP